MKLGLISLGCPKNLVDGEVMLGLAREAGHEITGAAHDADVIVVNTCAFIDAAKEESIDAILEAAELRRQGRCRRLVVTGCLAERYREQLRAEIPDIDVVLGTGEVPEIVGALAGASATGTAAAPVRLDRSAGDLASGPGQAAIAAAAVEQQPHTYLYDASTPRVLSTPRSGPRSR